MAAPRHHAPMPEEEARKRLKLVESKVDAILAILISEICGDEDDRDRVLSIVGEHMKGAIDGEG